MAQMAKKTNGPTEMVETIAEIMEMLVDLHEHYPYIGHLEMEMIFDAIVDVISPRITDSDAEDILNLKVNGGLV